MFDAGKLSESTLRKYRCFFKLECGDQQEELRRVVAQHF
jgi:hypothetical protein